jgi:hypothetical protein
MIQSVSSAFDKRGVKAAAAPILYGATISATVSACAFIKFVWQTWNEGQTHGESSPASSDAADTKQKENQDENKQESSEPTAKPTPKLTRRLSRRSSSGYLADFMTSEIWEEVHQEDIATEEKLKQPAAEQRQRSKGSKMTRQRSSFLATDFLPAVDEDSTMSPATQSDVSKGKHTLKRRNSAMFRADLATHAENDTKAEVAPDGTISFATRWGLMLLACFLKMVAYWCQLKANERIFSSHLSAIRKSGVLLVLLLGRLLFNEEIGNKLMPVGTMLAGVAILAMK